MVSHGVLLNKKRSPVLRRVRPWHAAAELRRACAAKGLCKPDPRDTRPAPKVAWLPLPVPKPPTPPKRPPAAEVAALWAACRPVTADAEVADWLRSRALDPAEVELRDLARALPADLAVPGWARRGAPWPKARQGYRVIVPMYGAEGRMESLRARALRPADAGDKTAVPAGAELVARVGLRVAGGG